MASDSESVVSLAVNHDLNIPSTPADDGLATIPSSQATIPLTEDGDFHIEPDAVLSADVNGCSDRIIPSSLTPPPSSQKLLPVAAPDIDPTIVSHTNNSAPGSSGTALLFTGSQHSHPFSPPATGGNFKRTRPMPVNGEYIAPTKTVIEQASADELRAMLHECIADHSRVKMEVAHHKFQLNLASLQAADDAERAAVEHEMALREVETLRNDQNIRQTRRDLSTVSESTHAKYLQLKLAYSEAMEDIANLCKKLKTAKKVIRQNQDEISVLHESRTQLLNRIRENREHFNMLRSPGGILHTALAPNPHGHGARQAGGHASQPRAPLKQFHSFPNAKGLQEHGGQEPLAALLQALEKNSAPTTPVAPARVSGHTNLRHTRNVQSLSSLPNTPITGLAHNNEHPSLLPSIDLVPQTEPPRRHTKGQHFHGISCQRGRSRESTISVPDTDEDLARRAMNFLSRGNAVLTQPAPLQTVQRNSQTTANTAVEAGQATTEAERHDACVPAGPANTTESVTERALQLHAKILSPSEPRPGSLHVSAQGQANSSAAHQSGIMALSVPAPMGAAAEKRKFSEGLRPDPLRDILASPLKKARSEGVRAVHPGIVSQKHSGTR